MLRRLASRALRALLRANTGPVDALIFALALCWLAFLVFTPDAAYAHAGVGRALAYKAIWVWPALLANVATPVGWMSGQEWVHRGARIYAVMWWVYIAVATAVVTPTIIEFWAPATCCAVAGFWLLAREGANAVAHADPRR